MPVRSREAVVSQFYEDIEDMNLKENMLLKENDPSEQHSTVIITRAGSAGNG